MEAMYVTQENIRKLENDVFEITVTDFELDYAVAERAKLYLGVDGVTETGSVRFYGYTDSRGPTDFPVCGPGDFEKAEDGLFRLSVNISEQLGERPS